MKKVNFLKILFMWIKKMTIENILNDMNISIPMIKILDNFFKKENLEIKIDIFSEKRNKFFKLKNENPNVEFAILDLAAFYFAIKSFYDLKTKVTKKNKILSTNELKKYDNFLLKSSKKNKRISKKENSLLDKSSIISSLISENKSYREMSIFFKKYHKLNVSHTYIKQIIDKYPIIFNKVENSND